MEKQLPFLPEPVSPDDWNQTPETVKALVECLLARMATVEEDKRGDRPILTPTAGEAIPEITQCQALSHSDDVSSDRPVMPTFMDWVMRSQPDTTIIEVNQAVYTALGRSPDDVIGLPWCRVLSFEDSEEIHRTIAALTPEHPTVEHVSHHTSPGHHPCWFQWSHLGLFGDRGQLVEIHSIGRDVTALHIQIQREQALNRVFQAIRKSLDLDTIFATATAETAQLLKNLDCFVVQYRPDEQVWKHIAEYRHNPNTDSVLGLEVPDAGNPFAERLKQLQRVQVDDTGHLEDDINREVAQALPGAWLLIPLVVDGTLWGSFTVISTQRPFVWQPDQVTLAQSVADQLEVAIQQANLYHQVQLELAERQRVEVALRESEARFQNMAANVPGAIFRYVLRPDGSDGVLYMSPGCYGLWEVEAQAVVADAAVLWRMVHPEDVSALYTSVMVSAETLQPWSWAWRIITPSGREKWLEAAGRPTRQANGDIIWDTLILDVSERMRLEVERQQADYRFQTLAANMPGVIYQYVLHPDGSNAMLYVSPGCRELWELEPEDIMRDVEITWQMVHPDDLPAMRDSVWVSAQTLQPWRWEWRITTRSGRQKWLQGVARPQPQANGDIIWDGLILDNSNQHAVLHEREQAEAALKRSEQRFRNLFESTPKIAVQGYNSKRQVIYWNDASEHLYGYSKADALGRQLEDLIIPPEMRQAVIEAVQNWVVNDQPIPAGELSLLRKDGSRVAVYSSHIMFANPEGEREMYCVDIDLSDRKQAEVELQAQKEVLQVTFDHLPIMIGIYSTSGDVLMINRELERVIGWTKEDYKTVDVLRECYPNAEDYAQMLTHIMTADSTWKDFKMRVRDGRILDTSWAQVRLSDGRSIGIGQDISDRKQAEDALRESEARYRLLAENTNDLVCLHEVNGHYLYVSPSCEALLGYRYDEMLGRDPTTFLHPEDRDRVRQEAQTAAIAGKSTPITYRMRHRAGHYIWFETLTKPILNTAGQIVQLQTTSRDVTERIQVQEQLKHEALHDTLTGLPNRHLLMERLELAIHRTQRLEQYCFAVLFLDLDRFKVINDSLGHLAGDQLLIAIAHSLETTVRGIDLVARLGGDEFVILLEEIKDIQEAVRATERIFAALQTPLVIEGREVYTTCSIGIVLGTPEYTQPSHLLRDADIAMYRAKHKGKARYEIFDVEMHAQALNRLHLENDLRRAIAGHEFVLHYQPIVELKTGMLAGFEALIRWQHPTEGLKPPGDFIAIAEEIGLITTLDYWAVRTACQQLATWQMTFPNLAHLKVSVNLSAHDLRQTNLIDEMDRVLSQTQLGGHCLTLEITESMLIEDIETTIQRLSQLKMRGIQISIDDFGTGYSSLNYLHRLPVDSLKVDRSFVQQIQDGKRNHQIVETIVALSNQLELDAIAEGIETLQQLQRLQHLGYRFGQGYLFSKPALLHD